MAEGSQIGSPRSKLVGETDTLLHRYPELEKKDLARLIVIFQELSLSQVAQLAHDPVSKSAIKRLRRDHWPDLYAPLIHLAVMLPVSYFLFYLAFWLAWHVLGGA